MEIVGVLIGAGIVAASPLVPVLRPVAKSAVKGGLALADMAKGAAAVAAYQWGQVVEEASAEVDIMEASAEAGESSAATDIAVDVSVEKMVAKATDEAAFEVAAAVSDEVVPTAGAVDDLKLISGIGPKVEGQLQAAGITSFEQIAETDTDQLRQILLNAGSGYRTINPDDWPAQARDLASG